MNQNEIPCYHCPSFEPTTEACTAYTCPHSKPQAKVQTAMQRTCREILLWYGGSKQKLQAVQELSELICILTRRKDQIGPTYKQDLTSEIADCCIMIEQMRQAYGIDNDALDAEIERKLDRTIGRMKKDVKHD